jgi:hypothetical protein
LKKPTAGPPARSIVHKFAAQIKTLVEDLESTRCSFIRCVKPNPLMIRDDKVRLAAGVGRWCWPLVLAAGVGRWCWPLVLAAGVGRWCCRRRHQS